MALLLEQNSGIHPRALSAKFRKIGTQISVAEKKALGMRSNTFYSHEALATLTEKGRANPLHAHEITLLRAYFNYARANTIKFAQQNNMDYLKASGAFADCPGCELLSVQRNSVAKRYSFEEAKDLPPPGCNREACAVTLMGFFDFLKNIR